MCIFQKPNSYSNKLLRNFKRGAGSSDQNFLVHFCVRNMGKIVPPPKKNLNFFKSINTDITLLKLYLYFRCFIQISFYKHVVGSNFFCTILLLSNHVKQQLFISLIFNYRIRIKGIFSKAQ